MVPVKNQPKYPCVGKGNNIYVADFSIYDVESRGWVTTTNCRAGFPDRFIKVVQSRPGEIFKKGFYLLDEKKDKKTGSIISVYGLVEQDGIKWGVLWVQAKNCCTATYTVKFSRILLTEYNNENKR